MSAICRFIHAEKANCTIVLLCKVMKTVRSTYSARVPAPVAAPGGGRPSCAASVVSTKARTGAATSDAVTSFVGPGVLAQTPAAK
ncbi:hypothetical protein ACWDZ4_12560 [Streptomyces sp. NPDC003016]